VIAWIVISHFAPACFHFFAFKSWKVLENCAKLFMGTPGMGEALFVYFYLILYHCDKCIWCHFYFVTIWFSVGWLSVKVCVFVVSKLLCSYLA